MTTRFPLKPPPPEERPRSNQYPPPPPPVNGTGTVKKHNLISCMDYNTLENIISNIPRQYYPALLIKLVEESYKKRVWLKGGASKIVLKIEERME